MLGVSAAEMARLLGLSDGRAVRRFEADVDRATARAPQGAVVVLYRLILGGLDRTALEVATATESK